MSKAIFMTINRLKRSDSTATISEVYLDDEFVCFAIEQPWNDNKPFESCVPTGVYNLEPFSSPKYGQTYALTNKVLGVTPYPTDFENGLTNRYAILLHSANWAFQLQGCIALGEALIVDGEGRHMVTNSKKTIAKVFERIDSRTMIEITNEGDWG